MLFSSWVFWVFLPIVLLGYSVLPRRGQNALLFSASYVFYGWWDWRFLGLLVLSTVVDFFIALRLDDSGEAARELAAKKRKRLLIISIAVNLGVLGFFKYFGFFEDSLITLLSAVMGRAVEPTGLDIILPVGISFYTFQSMSYTIDVYRREMPATTNLLDFATFVAFFPQLVAGPIVRAADLLPQLQEPRRDDAERFGSGVYLMVWGLFKKVVIADNLAPIVDQVFAADPSALSGGTVLIASYAFAVQIYCDFSGYTDIARGCARLFGFEFPLNFNIPYAAKSPSEFWRRWHMSLSTWLRDYLYIPLGGNRGSRLRTDVNLMITMLLGGLWHGASWTFVLWGAYQGGLLVLWRVLGPRLMAIGSLRRAAETRTGVLVQWIVFFNLVCLGWLIFRAQGFTQLGGMMSALGGPFEWARTGRMALQLAILATPLILMQLAQHFTGKLNIVLTLPAPVRGIIYAGLIVGITLLGRFEGNEFIYFQF